MPGFVAVLSNDGDVIELVLSPRAFPLHPIYGFAETPPIPRGKTHFDFMHFGRGHSPLVPIPSPSRLGNECRSKYFRRVVQFAAALTDQAQPVAETEPKEESEHPDQCGWAGSGQVIHLVSSRAESAV